MPESIPVRVRDCACPDTPHAESGDIVWLRPSLTSEGGIIAEQQMLKAAGTGDQELLAREWLPTFIRYGAVGWNFIDPDGEALPFDPEAILEDWRLARPVFEKATDLYSDQVMDPFQKALAAKSPTGRTGRGTSQTRGRTSA